jgi:hypothetical protein
MESVSSGDVSIKKGASARAGAPGKEKDFAYFPIIFTPAPRMRAPFTPVFEAMSTT